MQHKIAKKKFHQKKFSGSHEVKCLTVFFFCQDLKDLRFIVVQHVGVL
jgi:hypothetical protein